MRSASFFAEVTSSPRRYSLALLILGAAQLVLLVGTAAQSFFVGNRTLLLLVHASERFGRQPPLSRIIQLPPGAYITGTQGELLYHATSLWDYVLFYRIGDIDLLDSLFLCGLGVYLYYILQRAGHQSLLGSYGRAFSVLGVTTMAMFTLKLAFNALISQLFQAKTNYLFNLNVRTSNVLYVVFGLLLLLCAGLLQQSQQPARAPQPGA